MTPAPNQADRVRDHLANERTYLAWIRTAVAMMGFGVVIVRLRHLVPAHLQGQTHGWELGMGFAVLGLLLVPLATAHYLGTRRAIEAGVYQPGASWVLLFSVAVAVLGAACVGWVARAPLVGVFP